MSVVLDGDVNNTIFKLNDYYQTNSDDFPKGVYDSFMWNIAL
jgi:hypothetical protein